MPSSNRRACYLRQQLGTSVPFCVRIHGLLSRFSCPRGDLAPLIAIVGCDGAGKSTVSDAVIAWLRETRDAEACHLGVQSKTLGDALMRLPLIGKTITRLVATHTRRSNDAPKDHSAPRASSENEAPTTLVAVATYLLSLRRWWRFQKMMELRRRGVAIVADRYPQVAVLQMKSDGPGLANFQGGNVLVRFLARREKALYAYMTSYRPDLVIRLNVDLETAFARKPDHRYESLASKIAAVPLLSYQGAPIVDLDSREPLEQVVAQAREAVATRLTEH